MPKTNVLIFSVMVIFAFIFFLSFSFRAEGSPQYKFSLRKSYDSYVQDFMSKDGRIMDPEKDNITTSEGQSYMLLRSVILGDKKTFDLVFKWSKDNLQRKDKLFAWLWGKNPDGEYKILDNNSATDADVDIAFVLLIAYEKWKDEKYLNEAMPIINAIWNNETKRVGDYLILMPGNKQITSDKIEVNPSYFSPYAFRFFEKYDPIHDWNCLIDSSYYYLEKVMAKTATGLPPNWFLIENIETEEQRAARPESQSGNQNEQIVLENSPRSDFSYDAIRVFQRIYLDYLLAGETRALPILEHSKFFVDKWEKDKTFYVNYQANGQLRDKDKFIGSIAILIPTIASYDSNVAKKMYKEEVVPYLDNEKYWKSNYDYYGKNLLWFGYYLYNKNSKEYKEMYKRRITQY